MGKSSVQRPERLASKLVEIRQKLGLSQNEMIKHLGYTGNLTQAEISAFERGVRVPPLLVLLSYARSIKINLEILIDDKMELPQTFKISKK